MLDRVAIAARIPHGSGMCLLDQVVAWDGRGVRCTAHSHHDLNNPLRGAGAGLPIWAGIEYAAQAAAVHGSLLQTQAAPRRGVLAAARDLKAGCERLDEIGIPLTVTATMRHGDPAGAIYAFEVSAADRPLLSGQLTLMFVAGDSR